MNKQNQAVWLWVRKMAAALPLVMLSLSSLAQNAVQSVTGSIQGGSEVIRIDFAQPLTAIPAGFAIQAPARIALDFPGVTNAIGRSTVEINQGQVGVDIRQQGQSLVVEFLRSDACPTTCAAGWTSPTSARRCRASVTPSRGRPRAHGRRAARQLGAQRLPERQPVRARSAPAEARPEQADPGPGLSGEKLSLNFQNIEVRALLQVIADFTNFNVVTSDTVTGAVTLRLKDVPWDQALDIILQAKGLGVRKNGNVLWIAPKDELAAKEQLDLESKKKIAELEPLRTQSFQLNYTKAEVVAKGLTGQRRSGWRRWRQRGQRAHPVAPRQRDLRDPHQPAVRHRHPVQAGRDPEPDRQDRHPGAPGADRGTHRRGRRQLRPSLGVKLGGTDLRGVRVASRATASAVATT
jgi:hypothetical protein